LRGNTEKSFLVLQFYIRSFNPNFASKFNGAAALVFFFGEDGYINCLFLQALNDKFYWVKDGHSSWCVNIQILPHFIFEHSKVNIVLVSSSRYSDGVTEIIDGLSWIASSSHSVDGQNSGIVPSMNSVCEDQLMQLSLRKHSVCNI
jgi:hypothetical protein